MSRRAQIALALAAAAAIRVAAQPPASQQPKQYIVDWVMSGGSMQTPIQMTMHVSKSDDKQRIDMDMPAMNPTTMQFYQCTQSTIVRPDLQKVYIVSHYNQQYTEKAFNPKLDMTDPRSDASKIEELGSETVNGEDCTKYRITSEQGPMLLWMSKRSNLMMKMTREGKEAFSFESRNLQLTTPPPETFEVPAGYKDAGGNKGEVAKGVMAGIATGIASAFMPNMVGGAAAAAQASAMQNRMRAEGELMAKNCKPGKMPGMR